MASYCGTVLETCAYAGTGDVLKVQQMLATAGEHIDTDDANAWKVWCPPLTVSLSVRGPLATGYLLWHAF